MFAGDLQTVGYVIGALIAVMNLGVAFWKKKADPAKWVGYKKTIEYIRLGVGVAVTAYASQIFTGIDASTVAFITPSIVGGSLVAALAGKKVKAQITKEKTG